MVLLFERSRSGHCLLDCGAMLAPVLLDPIVHFCRWQREAKAGRGARPIFGTIMARCDQGEEMAVWIEVGHGESNVEAKVISVRCTPHRTGPRDSGHRTTQLLRPFDPYDGAFVAALPGDTCNFLHEIGQGIEPPKHAFYFPPVIPVWTASHGLNLHVNLDD